MATFVWYVYCNEPAWNYIGENTLVFSSSATDLTQPITVGTEYWNEGTHLGDGLPGDDQCGTNHVPNVKYVSSTQFDGGAGTETLNATNLTQTECTLRVKFTDASAVAISDARFYAFDGATVTSPAVDIAAYAWECGGTSTTWTLINNYTTTGTGGDNSGERLELEDQSSSTQHYYYIAISARPLSVGSKTNFDMGIALTYS